MDNYDWENRAQKAEMDCCELNEEMKILKNKLDEAIELLKDSYTYLPKSSSTEEDINKWLKING